MKPQKLVHRKMCNMRKTMRFLKHMLKVHLTHGKRVKRETHV